MEEKSIDFLCALEKIKNNYGDNEIRVIAFSNGKNELTLPNLTFDRFVDEENILWGILNSDAIRKNARKMFYDYPTLKETKNEISFRLYLFTETGILLWKGVSIISAARIIDAIISQEIVTGEIIDNFKSLLDLENIIKKIPYLSQDINQYEKIFNKISLMYDITRIELEFIVCYYIYSGRMCELPALLPCMARDAKKHPFALLAEVYPECPYLIAIGSISGEGERNQCLVSHYRAIGRAENTIARFHDNSNGDIVHSLLESFISFLRPY
jgi:hypothetical protein